jgi:hypothetical protein
MCLREHMIQACVFYRTHTLLSIHLDILNPQVEILHKRDWYKYSYAEPNSSRQLITACLCTVEVHGSTVAHLSYVSNVSLPRLHNRS